MIYFSDLIMTVTSLKWEATNYDSKSISILINHNYKVYVNGTLVDQFVQRFCNNTWLKFKYFGKKKTANGYDYHHVEFLQ